MLHAIILPVATGFILFLLGMKLMETSLQTWAGPSLQLWLERFTRTPVRGLLTGTVLTAALQSSTAITVIAIGLVGADRFNTLIGAIFLIIVFVSPDGLFGLWRRFARATAPKSLAER